MKSEQNDPMNDKIIRPLIYVIAGKGCSTSYRVCFPHVFKTFFAWFLFNITIAIF